VERGKCAAEKASKAKWGDGPRREGKLAGGKKNLVKGSGHVEKGRITKPLNPDEPA